MMGKRIARIDQDGLPKLAQGRSDVVFKTKIDQARNGERVGTIRFARLREIGLRIDSGNAPTLDLLDKAASLYPAVARAEQNAEVALFGADGIPLWLNYFSNENLTYAVNNWVAAVEAASHFDPQRPLHILELGAGAGSVSVAADDRAARRSACDRADARAGAAWITAASKFAIHGSS